MNLKQKIATDSTNAGKTDAVVRTWLLALVSRNITSLSGDKLFQATDNTQFNALTDAKKSQWLAFCARENIDPHAASNVNFVKHIFGAATATITALNALRVESVPRWQETPLTDMRHKPTEHEINVARNA